MCRLYAESTLPNELWLMIFQQINDTKCLAQCRLVCKLFDSLAEKALLRQNLDLTTVDKIKKFLYHLNSKPKIARYINFIHLSDVAPLHLQRKLLNQALTPNIKSLTGEMRENVFDHFLNILQRSPDKFSQLQVLPNFPNLCRKKNPGGIFVPTCNYGQVLLYFKESLKQLTIQVQPSDLPQISESVIFRLNEFQNLTFLDLDFQIYNRLDDLDSYLGLDYILSNCTMNLEILYLHWRAKLTFMEKEDFKTWLQRNDVEQAPNLGELKITGVSSPHILEYLLYKYPNVSKLAIHNLDDFSDRIVKELQNMDSLFLAINDIPHPQRRHDMNRIEQFTDLIQSTQSTVNSLLISKRRSNSVNKEMFYIEKSISTKSTVYGVITNRYETSVHKELISLIGPVSSLRVLYDNHVDQQRLGEELSSLCKMIPFNNLNSLTHLELTGDVNISQAILKKIAHSSRLNLEHLTINCCFCSGEAHDLSLPNINLEMISFKKLSACRKRCLQVQSILLITKQTNASQDEEETYYLLTEAGATAHCEEISKNNLSKYHENLSKICILFRSWNNLNIKLGNYKFNMASVGPNTRLFCT